MHDQRPGGARGPSALCPTLSHKQTRKCKTHSDTNTHSTAGNHSTARARQRDARPGVRGWCPRESQPMTKRGSNKRTANPAYRKRRAELLRDKPLCHWCKRRPATEADHVVPYDIAGDDTELVPSCKPCNAKRGAIYKARKNAKRNTKQQKVFFNANELPKHQIYKGFGSLNQQAYNN